MMNRIYKLSSSSSMRLGQRQRSHAIVCHNAARNFSSIINKEEFEKMREEMKQYDAKREDVIKVSRDVLKSSKQAIFSLQRKDFKGAESSLEQAEKNIENLLPIIAQEPSLRNGSFSASMEEYAEARCFQSFITAGALVSMADMKYVNRDEYLGGVIDFTGELNRYAIHHATNRNIAEVEKCRDITDALFGEFLQFDFRNNSLRKKYDSIKYNLKKMENTLYELSLVSNVGIKPTTSSDEEN